MDRLFRKDGMISVFLILVLASMIGAMLMFVGAAINQAEQVLCKEYIHLAGRSLLSEYHIPLKERYNLFATDLNLHQQEATMVVPFLFILFTRSLQINHQKHGSQNW